MNLAYWGRGLAIAGLAGLIVGAGPALLLSVLPPEMGDGFFGIIAIMLTLTVAPIAALALSVGALLLLLGWLRRERG